MSTAPTDSVLQRGGERHGHHAVDVIKTHQLCIAIVLRRIRNMPNFESGDRSAADRLHGRGHGVVAVPISDHKGEAHVERS